MERWRDVQVERWTIEQVDKWRDGEVERWRDVQVERWTSGDTSKSALHSVCLLHSFMLASMISNYQLRTSYLHNKTQKENISNHALNPCGYMYMDSVGRQNQVIKYDVYCIISRHPIESTIIHCNFILDTTNGHK